MYEVSNEYKVKNTIYEERKIIFNKIKIYTGKKI